jgi:hypothetical protein
VNGEKLIGRRSGNMVVCEKCLCVKCLKHKTQCMDGCAGCVPFTGGVMFLNPVMSCTGKNPGASREE